MLTARSRSCNLNTIEIYYIPFEKIKNKDDDNLTIVNHPFKSIITEIQGKRREYPKGSINNLLYKEMGNSIYGAVVRSCSLLPLYVTSFVHHASAPTPTTNSILCATSSFTHAPTLPSNSLICVTSLFTVL